MKSRYIPFVQQPYCCAAACLQMVMYRLKIPLIPQEDIAYELGLVVPKADRKFFQHPRQVKKPDWGWGTNILSKGHSIDEAMKRLEVPLRARFYWANDIPSVDDLLETLRDMQEEDGDILVCFDHGLLWGNEKTNGHVCVFDRVEDTSIWLVNPEREAPKHQKVEAAKLYGAMKDHFEDKGAGGLWLIERTEEAAK